ncbi:MAG TPA: magnesium transporter [Planctomycetota bacterium]|nr:magnesium transporter [Planctomycetota bacterium]
MSEPEQPAVFDARLSAEDLRDAWRLLDTVERAEGFRLLDPTEGEEFFIELTTSDQVSLLSSLSPAEQRFWLRALAPDDTADFLQEIHPELRAEMLAMLDEASRREVRTLLAYAEDDAGGLMSTRYARVRPEMTVDEAILYLRKQANARLETIYYGYVLDQEQHLLGVVSLRQLFQAKGNALVRDMMHTDLVQVPEEMDQETVGRIFAQHDLVALPVIDASGRMKGIVTVDDIVDVVQEEATEDIQKIGGSEALDAPYLEVSALEMVKKRIGWLVILFTGEMLTVSALGSFDETIRQATILPILMPLIISSGGNAGSQASTLVIRAMALGEARLSDWWRVLRREIFTAAILGIALGALGILRIVLGDYLFPHELQEGIHVMDVALTVGLSVLAVVMWGAITGSMLPILLRKLGFDPASASAPMVATLVDVTGVLIYFGMASALIFSTMN